MFGLFYILFLTAIFANCQRSFETINNTTDTTTTNQENSERILPDEETTPQNPNTDFTSESYDLPVNESVTNEIEVPVPTETVISNENPDETTVFKISTESVIENSTEEITSEAQDQTTNFETTEPTQETEAFNINTESSIIPSPTITINLPIVTTITILTTTKNLCGENEMYSCLPWCSRTCNNPLSKLICRPSHNHLCRRGCTCKNGFLYEKTIGKCVKKCPVMQLL